MVVLVLSLMAAISASAFVPVDLTDKARVSFITCGSGKEIFTKFGHSGIRINDPQRNIDIVFHWGIFIFDSPAFALRFMLGETDYQMGPFYSDIFFDEYEFRGSAVVEQDLNLTNEQVNRLWRRLCSDYASDRRFYRYNFIESNCATMAYDEITELYGDSILFDFDAMPATTYRDLINEAVNRNSWYNLGINIIIGSDADTVITAKSTVAFPSYTQMALNHCYFDSNGEREKVVAGERFVLRQTNLYTVSDVWYFVQIALPLLLTIILLAYCRVRHRFMPILTQLLCIVYGILGLLILFLWFVSFHPLVADNYNILWFTPLLIVLGIVICFRRNSKTRAVFSLLSLISIMLYPIAAVFGLQYTNLPLMMWWLLIFTAVTLVAVSCRTDIKRLFSKQQ